MSTDKRRTPDAGSARSRKRPASLCGRYPGVAVALLLCGCSAADSVNQGRWLVRQTRARLAFKHHRYGQALEECRAALQITPGLTYALRQAAEFQTMNVMGGAYLAGNDPARAEKALRQAIERADRCYGADDRRLWDPAGARMLVECTTGLASIYADRAEADKAGRLYRRAMAVEKRFHMDEAATAAALAGLDYAPYAARVKERLFRSWQPPAAQNKTVTVSLEIMGDGKIAHVALARPSGEEALDRYTLEAVRNAGPLPPPPAGAESPLLFEIELVGPVRE